MRPFSRKSMRRAFRTSLKRPAQSALTRVRQSLYQHFYKQNHGVVPCFCCQQHVEYRKATLEHVVPRSKGGANAPENFAISHYRCNQARGNGELKK